MKCLKCKNNVLPGSSTCPCCGNVVDRKLVAERSKVGKVTARNYSQRKQEVLKEYNSSKNVGVNNSSNTNVINVIKKFFVIFIAISIATSFLEGLNEELYVDPVDDNFGYSEETDSSNQKDTLKNIEIVEEKKAKSGDIVFILKNNNDYIVSGNISLKFDESNNNKLDSVSEHFAIAPLSSCLVVFDSYSVKDVGSYKKNITVMEEKYLDYFELNINDIKTVDNGSVIEAEYLNGNRKISSAEVCVLFYKGLELTDTKCDYAFSVLENTTIKFSYNYIFDKNYYGLEFDSYKLYLVQARYE